VVALILLVPAISWAEGGVQVTFELATATVSANEPVYLRLSFHNGLREGIRFVPAVLRDDYLDLSVTEPSRSIVTPAPLMHGGLLHVGAVILPPGGTATRSILINEFYQFRKAGKYAIRARLNAPIRTESGKQMDPSWQDLTLEVMPRDPKRLEKICQSLAKAAAGYGNYEALSEAATALSYIQDPVAVPYLAQVLGYDNFVSGIAVDGLVRIGGPEALRVLTSNLNKGHEQLRMKIQGGIYEIKTGTRPQIMD
jgi:hypothetical protein